MASYVEQSKKFYIDLINKMPLNAENVPQEAAEFGKLARRICKNCRGNLCSLVIEATQYTVNDL